MIVVRNVFRLKFGQSKQAVELWRQAVGLLKQSGMGGDNARLLTDLAGAPFYTLVFETTHDSLAQWEQGHAAAMKNEQWRAVYQQIVSLTESGHREILSVL